MLFNSIPFFIFLPIVFGVYWILSKKVKIQNLWVFAASYVFYGWWDWRFLILIVLTTALSFWSGILISKYRKKGKVICGINIIINIGILCYFKYFNFFADNLKLIFGQIGYQLDWFTIDVLLPVGISFYTFQALSYSIDVYRKEIKPTSDYVAFSAFIAFFPQLVAGPIERSTNLLPQFYKRRKFDYSNAVTGMRQILWGFFKKLVIADNCAFFANKIFENSGTLSGSMMLLGGLFFTFQIYGDFSGYSDIAIGTARLFDIKLMRNFNLPYFSRNISEFWRRWHISLNKWFVDYVYIPLGGSRKGKANTIRNTLIVFALSGLWHGAEWTFVLWGIYNGLLMVLWTLFIKNDSKSKLRKGVNINNFNLTTANFFKIVITFIFVVFGWIIFRAENISQLSVILSSMVSRSLLSVPDIHILGSTVVVALTGIFIFVMVMVEWIQRKREFTFDFSDSIPKVVRWCIYLATCLIILCCTGQQAEFIYFQF